VRTSTTLAPDPKLASSTGASPAAEPDPTTTSAPTPPHPVGPDGTRRLAATPCARSAAHMSESQPIVSALLTWPATQVAACIRAAPEPPRAHAGGTACGRGAEAVRDGVPPT